MPSRADEGRLSVYDYEVEGTFQVGLGQKNQTKAMLFLITEVTRHIYTSYVRHGTYKYPEQINKMVGLCVSFNAFLHGLFMSLLL